MRKSKSLNDTDHSLQELTSLTANRIDKDPQGLSIIHEEGKSKRWTSTTEGNFMLVSPLRRKFTSITFRQHLSRAVFLSS